MNFPLKVWFFLPAAAANAAPVFSRHPFFRKNFKNIPLDFGRNFSDGKRIFGDGKTFLGTSLGILAGTALGALQGQPLLGFFLSFGALLGDVVKSFFKRRLGYERGKPILFVDQLDFVIGAVLLTLPLGFFSWTFLEFLLLCAIVLPFHRLSGMLGHFLKIKREPW